ncbi:glycine--tRNA ligase subunit beta [Oenococcus oeni]|uniref:glycine--tRNA ligase subunit beta n=1 Tax=Oenococcus oeni TaxID=1247 RepID=UPI0007A74EBF|nr:glycine--tRNA ligase subunit beta [Oenococcus oeni]KZD14300.1 Glycyl-tRNA synthetase beta chain [Oenococcus oeni]
MEDYLLEIGLEEIPAHLVTESENQLIERIKNFFSDNLLDYKKIQAFSTPRRLAVLVHDLSNYSQSKDEELRGPSLKVAKDESGNWSRAAEGFARSQGTSPAEFDERDGYVYLNKHIEGVSAEEILKKIGIEVVEKMKFSTYMKWADFKLEYVRPIRWLVSLLDSKIVPFQILDVKADRFTRGHRFLSGGKISISEAGDYEETLNNAYVIVDAKVRKNSIRNQIRKIADTNDWNLHVDPDLLEEVNNIVEYPTAFAGVFDDKYLNLPEIVLTTSMRDNQRFFYVTNKQGKILPHFISVRNGDSNQIENVVKGNEKVLVARLEDAEFFFEEDQKHNIDFFMKKAERLVFHEKIGTMTEHMKRVEKIAALLANQLAFNGQEKKDLKRAANIYKFDLTTAMVGEFAELQGTMAGIYAKIFGENQTVCQALSEQYLPTSSEGDLPKSKVGAMLALADKLDTLFSFFAAGIIPSGSNDPYGLRRAALGIVRIIGQQKWNFSVSKLLHSLKTAVDKHEDGFLIDFADTKEISRKVIEFFLDRIRQQSSDIRYDLLDASTGKVNEGIINYIFKRVRILASHVADPDFRDVIEALTRVQNLAEKNKSNVEIDPELFVTNSEKRLYQLTKDKDPIVLLSKGDHTVYQFLASLKEPINNYFDENMIMDKNPIIKNNRVAQINLLNNLISSLGDLRKVVVK